MHQEIQLCKRKSTSSNYLKPKPKIKQDLPSESGVNLFKNILLKYHKVLGVKKSETLGLLKKRTNIAIPENLHDYCSAE